MKKLIPFLFVILSMSLFAQESTYWEKIDFEFDSGIKVIYCTPNAFDVFVVTDSNSIYKFIWSYGSLSFKDSYKTNLSIKAIREYNGYLYAVTENHKLFYKYETNQQNPFIEIAAEVDSSKINCITFEPHSPDIRELMIGTNGNGIYYFDESNSKWINVSTGIKNKNIIDFIYGSGMSSCFTDDNIIYKVSSSSCYPSDTLKSESPVVKIFSYGMFSADIYLNDNGQLYYKTNFEQGKFNLDSTQLVKCFTAHDYNVLCSSQLIYNKIPSLYNLLFASLNDTIYSVWDAAAQPCDDCYSAFSYLKNISTIEFNRFFDPFLCIAGTKDGKLYLGTVEIPSTVNEQNTNILNTIIEPQPSANVSKLYFTLPLNSELSIKLYNTLGMELKKIADGYFSEGENSIPIDVSDLPSGVYLVAIRYNRGTVVEKLVVSR
ncbi:T9SS type A sorting domain-containing protein [Bacteroidota bacterium]